MRGDAVGGRRAGVFLALLIFSVANNFGWDMKRMNQQFFGKWITVAAVSAVGAWQHAPYTIQVLLMMMGLDILSGIFAAASQKKLNSSIMLKGLIKKCAVFPILGALHIVEKPLNISFQLEAVAALAFIVYEVMSIIENAALAGVPIPQVVVDALAKAKVPAATPEEIEEAFKVKREQHISEESTTGVIKTPPGLPDQKVDTKTTVIEEKVTAPILDPTTNGTGNPSA